MRCRQAKVLLERELDGRLEAAGRQALQAHLQQCAACRARGAELRRTERLLAAAFVDHPFGEALAARIAAAATAGAAAAPTASRPAAAGPERAGARARVLALPRQARRWLGAGLAAAAALLLVVLLGERMRPLPQPRGGAGLTVARLEGMAPTAALRVERAGGGPGGYLPPGGALELGAGDRFTVESAGARLRFADGSVVLVRPDTTVQIEQAGPGRTELAIRDGPGELFCAVAPRPAGSSFAIRTPFGWSEVAGTRFGVRVVAGQAVTTVLEGQVRVRPLAVGGDGGVSAGAAPPLVLTAGEQGVLAAGTAVRRRLGPAAAAAELAWAIGPAEAAAGSRAGPAAAPAPLPQPPAPAAGEGGPALDLPVEPPGSEPR